MLMGSVQVASAGTWIKATRVDPSPNYHLTKDPDDIAQLTDGRTVPFPMWMNRAAVGWAKTTPIKLWLDLRGTDVTKSNFSGRLRIHTVARTKSGIQIPQRVDVYMSSKEKIWAHVQGVQFNQAQFQDGVSHWLEIEVADVQDRLLVVIHAKGEYVFADEILWEEILLPPVTTARPQIGGYQKAVADSISRLKEAFFTSTQASAKRLSEWSPAYGDSSIVAWVEDPWGALSNAPERSHIRLGVDKGLRLMGARDEMESGCVGILNPTNKEVVVTVGFHGGASIQKALQLHTLKLVTAADGKGVYDALIPYDSGKPLRLPAHSTNYLWVTAYLTQLSVGTHAATLEIRSTTMKKDFQLEIRVVDIAIGTENVHAVSWGYPEDKPIWQDPEAATADLVKHGINVFVIPPVRIPPPQLGGVRTLRDFEGLIETVRLYETQGGGTYLLFLDWRPERLAGRHIEWLHPDTGLPVSQYREIISQWVKNLDSAMQAAGVSRDRWALYPVDEYSGKHVDYLYNLFSLFKSIDPALRIYANPINTSSNPTRLSDLESLVGLVDLWQPELSFAESSAQSFFQSTNKGWDIYVVPPSPAKSVLPIFYRSLAWRAWRLGANGVGFWSYSGTRGTSAWDDLDGRMPDWAVVYEGNPLVSSRRWEAFREGVEDLRLLQRAQAAGSQFPLQVRAQTSPDFLSADISRFREGMLERP